MIGAAGVMARRAFVIHQKGEAECHRSSERRCCQHSGSGRFRLSPIEPEMVLLLERTLNTPKV
jgi:hypothetical protein